VRLLAVAVLVCVGCGDSQPIVTLAELGPDTRLQIVVIDHPWPGRNLPVESSIVVGVTLMTTREDCPRLAGPVAGMANGMVLEIEPGGWPEVGLSCDSPRAVTHQKRPADLGLDLMIEISDDSTTFRASLPNLLRDYTLTVVEPADEVLLASGKVRTLWGPDPLVDPRTTGVAASFASLEDPYLVSEVMRDSVLVEGNEIRFSVPEGAGWHTSTQLAIEGMDLPSVPAAECVGANSCDGRRIAAAVTIVQLNPLP